VKAIMVPFCVSGCLLKIEKHGVGFNVGDELGNKVSIKKI
jgi:hypothetical protein